MFTYQRASIFCELIEAISLYEAIKNLRQRAPKDKNIVRGYNESRARVKYQFKQLLDDGFQEQA